MVGMSFSHIIKNLHCHYQTLEYGLFLTNISNPKLKNKFHLIQNQAIRLGLGYRIFTPINVIHAEAKIIPFYYIITSLSNKFALKLIPFHDSLLTKKMKYLLHQITPSDFLNIMADFPIIKSFIETLSLTEPQKQLHQNPIQYNYKYAETIFTPNIDNYPDSILKKLPILKLNSTIDLEQLSKKNIPFTDASMIRPSDFNGIAFFIPSTNEKFLFKITSQSYIYTAEAIGILLAISHSSELNIDNIYIFTDSRSVLEALRNYSPTKSSHISCFILGIKSKLYKCKLYNVNVSLIWIPSHQNIIHNETVDSLAKKAINSGVQEL